jgi:hypothetical protein
MTAGADRWTTIGCVALLALIAGTVSYLHMHLLVELHGQPGWVAALTPLSVDGMIVAASTTLWPILGRDAKAEHCRGHFWSRAASPAWRPRWPWPSQA